MKKSLLMIVLCILATGMTLKSSRAQQSAPVYFAVFEEMVATSDMAAFNKVQQEAVDLWNKHGLDMSIYCYSTDNNSYFWVMPIENFAAIDAMNKKGETFMKKAKEQDGFDGSGFRDLSTVNFSFIQWMPDLSYHPDGKYGQTADKKYVEWAFCYMKPGHDKEAGEAIKKYIDFYKKTGEKYEWDVYNVVFGNDTPVWILMISDKDPVTMRQTESKLEEKYSKEFGEIWSGFAKHVRKIDNKTGWFKQKWSINTGL